MHKYLLRPHWSIPAKNHTTAIGDTTIINHLYWSGKLSSTIKAGIPLATIRYTGMKGLAGHSWTLDRPGNIHTWELHFQCGWNPFIVKVSAFYIFFHTAPRHGFMKISFNVSRCHWCLMSVFVMSLLVISLSTWKVLIWNIIRSYSVSRYDNMLVSLIY